MSSSTATAVALMTDGSAWMVIRPLVVLMMLSPADRWGAATRMLKGRQERTPLKKGTALSTMTGLGAATAPLVLVLLLFAVSGAGLEARGSEDPDPSVVLPAGAFGALSGSVATTEGLLATAVAGIVLFGCPFVEPRSWPADKHAKEMMQAAISSPLLCRS